MLLFLDTLKILSIDELQQLSSKLSYISMAKAPEELFSNDSNQKQGTTAVAQPVKSSSITPIDKALSALTFEQRGKLQCDHQICRVLSREYSKF